MKPNIDMVVVGAGSGGLAAAKAAADLGQRVVVVEASRVGGCCVQRGCVPKKLMVFASGLGAHAPTAQALGWAQPTGMGEPSHHPDPHSWHQLTLARDRLVGNLELAHQRHLAQRRIQVKHGHARLVAPQKVLINDEILHAQHIVWATGSVPTAPPFAGAEACLNSDAFFGLAHRPSKAVIIGGGYIACEFASLLQGLGTQVTLLVRNRLLSSFDPMVQQEVFAGLVRLGVDVQLGTRITEITSGPHKETAYVHARTSDGTPRRFGPQPCMIAALGRRPNTFGCGLEEAGVALSDNGAILVDDAHQSTLPGLYAVGDVIDRVNLTPIAIRAGRALAHRLFGAGSGEVDYSQVPRAVFTTPQVGAIGMTEPEATEQFGRDDVVVFASRFVPLVHSVAPQQHRPHAMTKLVVHARTDRVLGCHIVDEHAPEIIQGFAAAMTAGVTKRQIDATCAVHPTSAEELVLMRTPNPS